MEAPKFRLTFISQRNKLMLRFSKDGKVYRAKSTGTLYNGESEEDAPPSLALILSNYRTKFNTACWEYESDGIDPAEKVFPTKEEKVILTPKAYFEKYKCRIMLSHIDSTTTWDDFTDRFITDFKDDLESDDYADNTIRAYCRDVKKVLDSTKIDGIKIPSTIYSKILTHAEGSTTSVYLTMKEVALLESLKTDNDLEEAVRVTFLKSVYSGCRHSDLEKLKDAAIIEDEYTNADSTIVKVKSIRYISQKTNVITTIPLKSSLEELIRQDCLMPSINQMNRILPIICRKAGITAPSQVKKCDKDFSGEKWEFVRSHTGRKTLATNLYILGASIRTIANYLGHRNEATTFKNYIWCGEIYNEKVINGFFK